MVVGAGGKGISILISTRNNLKYLKASIRSLRKHSGLDNEICVYVDGSTDGTHEWLLEQPDVKFNYCPNWIGSLTGRNEACKLARRDHVFLSEDAFIYSPGWDLNLMKWNGELGDKHLLCPTLVEPTLSSFLVHDCGKNIEEFDEEGFLDFVKSASRDEVSYRDPFGLFMTRRDWYWKVGGHDVTYDPLSFGTLDLKLKLKKLIPDMRIARIHNSLIYHFPRVSWKHLKGSPEWESMIQEKTEYFRNKWGAGIPECLEKLRV